MKDLVGYSEFRVIFNVEDRKNFFLPGYELRHDGVWIIPPPEDTLLTPEEIACLTEHPKKDLTKPALALPCTKKQLKDFLEWHGLYDIANQLCGPESENHHQDISSMDKYFPALSIYILKLNAKRWAETFYPDVPIKRIVLYPYNSKYAGILSRKQNLAEANVMAQAPRYSIVFEIDADDPTIHMSLEEFDDYRKKICSGSIPKQQFDRLLYDIHHNETAIDRTYPQLLQPDFCSVYRNPPHKIPCWEWRFEAQFNNTELQDSIRNEKFEARIVLYPFEHLGPSPEKSDLKSRCADYDLHKIIWSAIDAAHSECRRSSTPEKDIAFRIWEDPKVCDAIRSVYRHQTEGENINLETVKKNLRRHGFQLPKGGGRGKKLPKFIPKNGT